MVEDLKLIKRLRDAADADEVAAEELDPMHYTADDPEDIIAGLEFRARERRECADMIEQQVARLTALESERDEMMKALAECRDAMPIPEAGSSLEGHWVSAIASPLEVSGYIGECYKTLKAERDALLNSLAAARQDASTAWERHAMATRIGNAAAGELATARGLIAELKAERDALLAAAGKEAVAWQVRRADGRIDGVPIQWENCTQELYDATLATGRYAGYENGPQCEVRALYTAPTAALENGDGRDAWQPQWIVNDLGELGVKVGSRFFFLYKGDNIEYGADCDRDGVALHDDGTQMKYRIVGKREFGEVCWPLSWIRANRCEDRYTENLVFTPGPSFGKLGDGDWKPLPAALSQKAGEQQ
jgi:hypothetical protein